MWSPDLIIVTGAPSTPRNPFSRVKDSARKIYQKKDEIGVPLTSNENKKKAADREVTEIKAKKEEEKQKNAEEENKKRKTPEEERKTAAKLKRKEQEEADKEKHRAFENKPTKETVDEMPIVKAVNKAAAKPVDEGVNTAVFDDDFGKDDSLGSNTLDIHSIQEHGQGLNQWIPLENCKSGEVLLSAEFVPLKSVQDSKAIENTVKQDSTKEALKQTEHVVKVSKEETVLSKHVKPLEDVLGETMKHVLEVAQEEQVSVAASEPASEPVKVVEVEQKQTVPGQKTLDIIALQEYQKFVPLTLGEKSIEVKKSLHSTPVKEATKEIKADRNITENAKLKDPKDIKASKEAERKPTETITETKDSKVVTTIVQQSKKEKKETIIPDSAMSKPQEKLEAEKTHINVINARDIEKKDKFGKADPNIRTVATEDGEKDGPLDVWIKQKKKKKEERIYHVKTEAEQIIFIKPHTSQMLCKLEKLTFLY